MRRKNLGPLESATRVYDVEQLARLLNRPLTPVAPRPTGVGLQTATVALSTLENAASHTTRSPRHESRDVSPSGTSRWGIPSARSILTTGAALAAISLLVMQLHARPSQGQPLGGTLAQAPPSAFALPEPAATSQTQRQSMRAPASSAREPTSVQPQPRSRTMAPTTAMAVAELASGHYSEATTLYQSLARSRPNEPVFAAIAAILERRSASRCKQRLEAGAIPCSVRSQ